MPLKNVSAVLFLIAVLALPGPVKAAAPGYLRYLPDVPLMDKMTELPDQALIFDKGEGRVIESAVLAGALSEKEVLDFYNRSLPALGWKSAGPQRFLRNEDQLIVKWEKVGDGAVVRFSVSPKQGQKQEKNF